MPNRRVPRTSECFTLFPQVTNRVLLVSLEPVVFNTQ
jgi:hypothetical protein